MGVLCIELAAETAQAQLSKRLLDSLVLSRINFRPTAFSSRQNRGQLGFEPGGFEVGHDLEVLEGAEAAGHALG